RLSARNGLPCDHVYSFAEDQLGNLWLYMKCGLVEITRTQLQAWWLQPEVHLQPRVLDMLDGVQPDYAPFDAAARDPGGRLWFVNGNAVQVLDPAHLQGNTVRPPVRIEELIADLRSYPLLSNLRLPPRTRDIQINYTALSFVAPSGVRFRYRLEGH